MFKWSSSVPQWLLKTFSEAISASSALCDVMCWNMRAHLHEITNMGAYGSVCEEKKRHPSSSVGFHQLHHDAFVILHNVGHLCDQCQYADLQACSLQTAIFTQCCWRLSLIYPFLIILHGFVPPHNSFLDLYWFLLWLYCHQRGRINTLCACNCPLNFQGKL